MNAEFCYYTHILDVLLGIQLGRAGMYELEIDRSMSREEYIIKRRAMRILISSVFSHMWVKGLKDRSPSTDKAVRESKMAIMGAIGPTLRATLPCLEVKHDLAEVFKDRGTIKWAVKDNMASRKRYYKYKHLD